MPDYMPNPRTPVRGTNPAGPLAEIIARAFLNLFTKPQRGKPPVGEVGAEGTLLATGDSINRDLGGRNVSANPRLERITILRPWDGVSPIVIQRGIAYHVVAPMWFRDP